MTDHEHVSDLRWDRLLAGELSADQRADAHAHAASCARCGARYRELEGERAAFALRPTPIALASPRRRRALWAPLGMLVAAAAVLLIVVVRRPSEPEDRRKGGGGVNLLLSAGQPDHLRPVSTGDTLRPGDYLQAGYSTAADGYGAVLSQDGAGQTMAYVGGDTMVALPAGTERSFPRSTVLDDVMGSELIAIVWCAAPQPLAPLVEELRVTRQLAPRAGCTVRLVALEKRARP